MSEKNEWIKKIEEHKKTEGKERFFSKLEEIVKEDKSLDNLIVLMVERIKKLEEKKGIDKDISSWFFFVSEIPEIDNDLRSLAIDAMLLAEGEKTGGINSLDDLCKKIKGLSKR